MPRAIIFLNFFLSAKATGSCQIHHPIKSWIDAKPPEPIHLAKPARYLSSGNKLDPIPIQNKGPLESISSVRPHIVDNKKA